MTTLGNTSFVLRSRTHWEAMDLGFAMAKQHARVLYGAWAMTALLPCLVFGFFLRESPFWFVLVMWWLKPLYEVAPLHCLSKAAFAERTSVIQLALSVRAALGNPEFWKNLTYRRLSPSRSLNAPVDQLELARGHVRRQRLAVLRRRAGSEATWLTILLWHLEGFVVMGVTLFALSFIAPEINEANIFEYFADSWYWVALYMVAMWLVGPLYVAAGFALYLNRRCELEGWDLEVGFRRLAGQLSSLIVCCAIITLLVPQNSSAGEAFTREQNEKTIAKVLADDIFHDRRIRTYPKFGDPEDNDYEFEQEPINPWGSFFEDLAYAARILFVAAVAGATLWLLFHYRAWLLTWLGVAKPEQTRTAPLVVAGVELDPTTMPDDPVAVARALWAEGRQRAALALVYRATLIDLATKFACVFANGDTEGDCLRRVRQSQPQERVMFVNEITQAWILLAYAHRAPADERFAALVRSYQEAMMVAPGNSP